jgi:hypothetical protein
MDDGDIVVEGRGRILQFLVVDEVCIAGEPQLRWWAVLGRKVYPLFLRRSLLTYSLGAGYWVGKGVLWTVIEAGTLGRRISG